ncbi:MAG: LemA family protein [Candidatus Altiarchaeota archaeon]
MILWILGFLVLVVLIFVYYYNKIVVLGNRIDNAWAQIDVQLKKRADLVPNLIETVQAYMKHEQKAIKMVTEAREKMLSAKTVEEKAKAGNVLEGALKTVFALAENYPQLRASENFAKLQEELSDIEDKIAYTRQFYNDSVLVYNNTITTIPGMWFAAIMGRTQQKPYLEIPEKAREVPKVKFDV